jgi:hypothetical protein
MLSFRSFISESKGFSGVVYHGTNARFDHFDQRKSRIVNDNYGGGVAYFTDSLNLALTYAKNMTKKQGGDPLVYSVELKLSKLFDVDHMFTGKELVDVLPADVKDFARGAGLLGLNADEYKVVSSLKSGSMSLSGEQVYRGLSKGNTQTAKAREHLIEKGYDGLRYNIPVTPKQSVYLAYDAQDIKIVKRQKVATK